MVRLLDVLGHPLVHRLRHRFAHVHSLPGRLFGLLFFLHLNGSKLAGSSKFEFILFIRFSQGPHIASVTLAAYECNSLDFPEPPYPNE